MTFTELKAKPGEYIWDEQKIQFVGRINKDGTEDKRFSKGGLCSLLNNIIETTGYVPNNPQKFAKRIAEHKQTQYLVKGYGVIVKCYDLNAEMWVAKAAEHLGIEGDGIADILQHVSTSKQTEHKAKIESLALIFGKELKSKKLADLTDVTEFEKRLRNQRRELAVKEKEAIKLAQLEYAMNKMSETITDWVVANNPKTILKAMRLAVEYNSLWCFMSQICGMNKLPKEIKKSFYKENGEAFYKLLEVNKVLCLSQFLAECAVEKYKHDQFKEEAADEQYAYCFERFESFIPIRPSDS